jgi:RNA polymerase sigma-70 factor (ECF subfamily)
MPPVVIMKRETDMQPEVLLAHSPFVRDLARSLTFGWEDPEDVVQQTFLRALQSPPAAGPGLRGWLAVVLRNVLRQSRRTRARRAAREALAREAAPVPTPDEIRDREAVRRDVVEAVLALREPYRSAVILRYYEELPPRKIAERLGDPVETVNTRLVRARRMLRERLDEAHGGDGRTWGIAIASLAGLDRPAPPGWAAANLPFAQIAAVLVVAVVIVGTAVSLFSPNDPGKRPEDPPPLAALDPTPAPAPTPAPPSLAQEEEKKPAAPAKAPPGAIVTGRVLDQATRKPVAGAKLRLCVRVKPFRVMNTVSDEEGRYRFAALPAGVPIAVWVVGKGRIRSVRMMRSGTRELKEGETVTWDHTVMKLAGVDLTITLRFPEGATPPKKIRVVQHGSDGSESWVDYHDFALDPANLSVTLFLARGRHLLTLEAPGWAANLPPRNVAGDGPPQAVEVALKRRTGIRLRLVDGEGRPIARAGVTVEILLVTSHSFQGNTNFSRDGLGTKETDASGEVDLTGLVPSPDSAVNAGDAIAFILVGEGIFKGGFAVPNHEVTLKEIARRAKEQGGGAVVVDVPALAFKSLPVPVISPDGKPVAGVRAVGRPAGHFKDEEYVSDSEGKITLRLLAAEPMMPGRRERIRIEALAPWTGRVNLSHLTMPEMKGAPPRALVVRRGIPVTLRFVNDGGEPIAWAAVEIEGAALKTDAAGVATFHRPKGVTEIDVKAPGHLPEKIAIDADAKEAKVRLERARELRVTVMVVGEGPGARFLGAFAHAVEAGKERIYRAVRIDQQTREPTLLVPLRTVTVRIDPRNRFWSGEVEAKPGVKEVVLTVKRK